MVCTEVLTTSNGKITNLRRVTFLVLDEAFTPSESSERSVGCRDFSAVTVTEDEQDLASSSVVPFFEADRMFDMGFEPQIGMFLQATRPDKQVWSPEH